MTKLPYIDLRSYLDDGDDEEMLAHLLDLSKDELALRLYDVVAQQADRSGNEWTVEYLEALCGRERAEKNTRGVPAEVFDFLWEISQEDLIKMFYDAAESVESESGTSGDVSVRIAQLWLDGIDL